MVLRIGTPRVHEHELSELGTLCTSFDLGGVYVHHPLFEGGSSHSKRKNAARQGWFVNANSLFGQPSNSYAVAVEDGEARCSPGTDRTRAAVGGTHTSIG